MFVSFFFQIFLYRFRKKKRFGSFLLSGSQIIFVWVSNPNETMASLSSIMIKCYIRSIFWLELYEKNVSPIMGTVMQESIYYYHSNEGKSIKSWAENRKYVKKLLKKVVPSQLYVKNGIISEYFMYTIYDKNGT